MFSTEVEDKNSFNVQYRSGGQRFFQCLVQKWRTTVLSMFSAGVDDKGSFNVQCRSGRHVLSILVQKWRTYILALFSSELEDKCSFNIQNRSEEYMFFQNFLKSIVQIMFHSICSLLILIYFGNKIVVTQRNKILLGKLTFLNQLMNSPKTPRFIASLIPPSYLRIRLTRGPFSLASPTIILCVCIHFFPTCTTRPAHRILLYFIFDDEHKLWSFSLCSFLQTLSPASSKCFPL